MPDWSGWRSAMTPSRGRCVAPERRLAGPAGALAASGFGLYRIFGVVAPSVRHTVATAALAGGVADHAARRRAAAVVRAGAGGVGATVDSGTAAGHCADVWARRRRRSQVHPDTYRYAADGGYAAGVVSSARVVSRGAAGCAGECARDLVKERGRMSV
eukprot:ctg_701.g364